MPIFTLGILTLISCSPVFAVSGSRSTTRLETLRHVSRELAVSPTTTTGFRVPSTLTDMVVPDMRVVTHELTEPLDRLRKESDIFTYITIYGSARIKSPREAKLRFDAAQQTYDLHPGDVNSQALKDARMGVVMSKYYKLAREFSEMIAREGEGKIAVVTGGGPGIMEAANLGMHSARGPSIGYNITLPHEQSGNPYVNPGLSYTFDHFHTRKLALRHGAMALVAFPGGFGTLDEIFEAMTLIQNQKIPPVPVIFLGYESFWSKIVNFSELARHGVISQSDLRLFTGCETAKEAWAAIRAAWDKIK